MRSPKLLLVVLALVAALVPSQAAAQAEVFNFPQNHDTVFGDNLFLGNFAWYANGHGARGHRTATNIERLEAFGFNLVLEPSCIFPGTNMTLDVYVNDRFVGNAPMPNNIQCNSLVAPIQGQFDLSSNPIAGLGSGKEFEIRFQLTGTSTSPCCGLAVFYKIDTNSSTIALAGSAVDDGGGGDDDPPPPPPPPVDDNGDVIDRIGLAESNLTNHVSTEGGTTRSAVQSVRDALGIVEGNVEASIAGAVLKVNAETALGVDRLASQLGISTNDLALAIKGNGNAIEKVQQSIADKLLPEVLKGQDLTKLTTGKVEEVGKNFLEKTLEQALSAGTGMLSLWSGGALLPVAGFLQQSIMSVVNGALRPDKIVKKAMAEFNRGLKRVKKLFSFNAAFDLPWDRKAVEAITFGFAAETVDIPEFPVDDKMLGPDKEEDNAFGAYLWFQRAYQTLVRPEHDNGNHYGQVWHDSDYDRYQTDRGNWDLEKKAWEAERAKLLQEKADLEKKPKK